MKKKEKNLRSSIKSVLEFIGEFIRIKDENSLSLSSMEVIKYYGILEKTLEFDSSISDYEKNSIVRGAVYDSLSNGSLNEKSFLSHFNKRHSEMLNSPNSSFRVITQFSLNSAFLSEELKFTINGSKVRLLQSLPKTYQKSRKVQEDDIQVNHGKKSLPRNIYCISYVTARSPQEAYYKAFNCIEILRAALNFSYNLKRTHIVRPYGPENYIIAGPTHTVHNIRGTAFDKLTHYEPEYNSGNKRISNPAKIDLLIKNTSHIIKQVNTLEIGPWIGKGLIMYVEALDISNPKLSFTMLWSVLDYFTVTTDNHSDTAKKASSIWKDQDLVKSILVILREVRNDFVHGGVSAKSSSDYLDILRGILDNFILFIINLKEQFTDTSSLEKYLNLPSSKMELANKLSEIKKQSELIELKLSGYH